jgi:uncharacterized membrane protein
LYLFKKLFGASFLFNVAISALPSYIMNVFIKCNSIFCNYLLIFCVLVSPCRHTKIYINKLDSKRMRIIGWLVEEIANLLKMLVWLVFYCACPILFKCPRSVIYTSF